MSTAPSSGAPKLAYTVAEVVAATGISRAKLYEEWRAGRGPRKAKLGKRTIVLHASLMAFLASLEVENLPPVGGK